MPSVRQFLVRALAIALVALPLRGAHAQFSLVNNLDQPLRGYTVMTTQQWSWAAQAFATDGGSYRLAHIRTPLGALTGAPTVHAELRAADGGVPGALLTTFSFAPIGAGAPAVTTLTPTTTTLLAPGTTYWLVFGISGTGSYQWGIADTEVWSGPGSIGSYAYRVANGPWANWGSVDPYYLDVVVSPTSVVPEPSTWALLGTGLAGVALATVRRRRAA